MVLLLESLGSPKRPTDAVYPVGEYSSSNFAYPIIEAASNDGQPEEELNPGGCAFSAGVVHIPCAFYSRSFSEALPLLELSATTKSVGKVLGSPRSTL